MLILLSLTIILIIIYLSSNHWKVFFNIKQGRFYQKIFRSRIERKRVHLESLHQEYCDKLIRNPEANINIKSSESNNELIEMTNLHKVRLAKFGQSKLNGVTFFKGPKGGIYIYTKNGKKRYL